MQLEIGIVGYGNFGEFLSTWLIKAKHNIYAWEFLPQNNERTEASELNGHLKQITFYREHETLADIGKEPALDILIICVSIESVEMVIQHLSRTLLKETLIVDILSVKEHSKRVLLSHFRPEQEILLTHPMFGPESGKVSWQGLALVYEILRVRNKPRRNRLSFCFCSTYAEK